MRCPYCRTDTQVVDTRDAPRSNSIRRRRKCPKCGNRFTTFETVQLEQQVQLAKRRVGDGDAFESWLIIIAAKLPPRVIAKINLGELRLWYDSGMELERAMDKIRQIDQPPAHSRANGYEAQPSKARLTLTPVQQAKFDLIKEKLRARQEALKAGE